MQAPGPQDIERNLWVVIRPADDVVGEWVAHCVDIDVCTQGSSVRHAIEMIVEALTFVIGDELIQGRDPFARRAPQEFWDELRQIQLEGEFDEDPDSAERNVSAIVVQLRVRIERVDTDITTAPTPSFAVHPAVWKRRALDHRRVGA